MQSKAGRGCVKGTGDELPEYVSIAGIKKRYGVTDKFVKMLGKPDEEVDNPHYKSSPPMKLFKRDRVEQLIEEVKKKDPAFFESMQKRRAAASKAVSTKKDYMVNLTKEILANLVIKEYDANKIPSLARKQFQMHEIDKFGDVVHEWNGGLRAEVAYIRHQLTNYHDILDKISGKVGSKDAYEAIKKALTDKISADYERRVEAGEP